MVRAAIGLGSNQGDSVRICRNACEALRSDPEIHILGVSSFYRTEPVGVAGQDWYVNAALTCETGLPAPDLLRLLIRIEQSFGRVRTERWGPRTLDLDILLYGDMVLRLPDLRVPHPRMHERLFVLAPLSEIAPEWIHPEIGLSVRGLFEQLLRSDHQQQICKLD